MAFESLLTVVAEMVAKPGQEAQLERQLLALVEPTRKETGCVQYDVHRHVSEPGRFVFYEKWGSKELLDQHLSAPHMTAFLAIAGTLLAEPMRVQLYSRIA